MKRLLRELKILIVEDTPTDAELMERELKRSQIWFRSIRVDRQEEYERSLEQFDPDVILSDYALPAFDGITALRIARQSLPHVPFIFVSGSIGEERAVEALRHGASDYIMKDRLQRLGPAVLRALEEVTAREERKRADAAVLHRMQFEECVAAISTDFIRRSPEQIDEGVHRALMLVGQFTQADRAYLLRLSVDRTSLSKTHEWTAQGVKSEAASIQNLALAQLPWLAEQLAGREPILVPRVSDLPRRAAAEKKLLEAQQVKSWLAVPLLHAESIDGVVGLHCVRTERGWFEDDVALLKIVGEIINTAVLRRDSAAMIERLNRQTRLILESAAEGIIGIDSNGAITFVNPSALKILGWTAEEMVGRNLHELAHSRHPDGSPYPWTECPAYVSLQRGVTESREEVFWRKDSSSVQVDYTSTPMADERGQRLGAVITLRDNEERKMLERQLEQANRLNSLGRLAATIAHEFNNVLMGIQPFNEVIAKQATSDPKIQKASDQIGKSIQRGKTITQQILRFTRPAPPQMERIDLEQWLADFLNEMRAVVPENIALNLSLADKRLAVRGDQHQLLQVLSNLVLNARDALGNQGSISIAANRLAGKTLFSFGVVPASEEFVHLAVADTGPGMSPDTMDRIFEPLFTTKPRGTGLGLAVSHQIIQQHGGHIFVESEIGRGTSFHLFLPAARSH